MKVIKIKCSVCREAEGAIRVSTDYPERMSFPRGWEIESDYIRHNKEWYLYEFVCPDCVVAREEQEEESARLSGLRAKAYGL